jgi:MYXO-CTERM domain-containing protein
VVGLRLKVGTALATVLVTVAVLLSTAAPAAAHGSLVLTVNDDGRGSVSVDVLWADGHPVTDPLAGTLTAVSAAGARVGPAPLTRLPDQSAVVYDGTLKPGNWTVTVDLALPGIGHCAAPVTVGPGAKAHSTRCGNTSPPSAAPVAAPQSGGDGPPWPLFGAAGAIVLATVAAIVVTRRRRGA